MKSVSNVGMRRNSLSGFDKGGETGDVLLFNTGASGSAYVFQDYAPNAGGTAGALMFSNGSAQVANDLAGTYDPSGFRATTSVSVTSIQYSG